MRLSQSMLLVPALILMSAACSTVRLTPSAAHYLKNGSTSRTAQDDLNRAVSDLNTARSVPHRVCALFDSFPEVRKHVAQSVGMQPDAASLATLQSEGVIARLTVIKAVDKKGNPEFETRLPVLRRELAQQIVDAWWSGKFKDVPDFDKAMGMIFLGKTRPADPTTSAELPPVVPGEESALFLAQQVEQRRLDVQQLQLVEEGSWEYFVDGSIFFSVEPLIAIRPDLEAVAIPSIAINWRPYNIADLAREETKYLSKGLSALAFQLTLGGAVNPSGSGENATGGAIGTGLSFPIAGYGAFSFGVVFYGDGSSSQGAPYISLSLGDFGKSTKGNGDT
ncbi:MAG: hypothetical protein NTV21_14535 [Planctomycetota bacterium]|nr:hypothetical protein [Planctomycetota bacterium]